MKNLYNRYYKALILIPLVLFLISLAVIISFYYKEGDFFRKDVTLEGGLSITVNTEKEINLEDFRALLINKFPKSDIFIRKLSEFGSDKQVGIIIEASEVQEKEIKPLLEKELGIKLDESNYSIEEAGGSLGKSFYRQVMGAMIAAFILVAIVIFIIFRSIVPSLAIIFSTMFDIIVAIAVIDILEIRLSTAGISALLLLIGYSVDDNILLNTKMLKRKEVSVNERILSAMKTGLTMTLTTIAAISVGFFIATSPVLKQIFLIILIGLLADIISTYLLNAGILKWHIER